MTKKTSLIQRSCASVRQKKANRAADRATHQSVMAPGSLKPLALGVLLMLTPLSPALAETVDIRLHQTVGNLIERNQLLDHLERLSIQAQAAAHDVDQDGWLEPPERGAALGASDLSGLPSVLGAQRADVAYCAWNSGQNASALSGSSGGLAAGSQAYAFRANAYQEGVLWANQSLDNLDLTTLQVSVDGLAVGGEGLFPPHRVKIGQVTRVSSTELTP